MALPDQNISVVGRAAQPAVPRSTDSGNPAAADIAALINTHPLSPFQKGIMVLIGAVILMDGFDIQAMGFVAPALTQDFEREPHQRRRFARPLCRSSPR